MYVAVFLFVISFVYVNNPDRVDAATKSFSELKAEYPDGSLFTKDYKNKARRHHPVQQTAQHYSNCCFR